MSDDGLPADQPTVADRARTDGDDPAADAVSTTEAVPADERDALLSIAHGAVVTGGGVSVKRGLSIWIEAILTRGLGPELYGVYAFGWRLTAMADAMVGVRSALDGWIVVVVGTLLGLVTFGAVIALFGANPRDRLVVSELTDHYRRTASAATAAVR